MLSGNKTKLQQDIVAEWYNNPNATNSEIAEACDCSSSYVSQVKNQFDSYDQLDAVLARFDHNIQRMFDEIEDDIDEYFDGVEEDLDDHFDNVEDDLDQMFDGI